MKLKRHREDVRDLKLQQDAHVQAIAKRYQRLILAAEAGITHYERNKWSFDTFHPSVKRVLEDAEE